MVFTSLFLLFVISCQGAQLQPWRYNTNPQFGFAPLNHTLMSTTTSCESLANRVFYGGTGGDKYSRIYRYVHTNETSTEFRFCDCSTVSGGCCAKEGLFSPFPEPRVVTSLSYYWHYPLKEIIFYTVLSSPNIYGMRRDDIQPRTFIFGEEHGISEILSVSCPLFGNCTFLAKDDTTGGLVIGVFIELDVLYLCKNIPNDLDGAKNFKIEFAGYQTNPWLYAWVKPDGSIWGAAVNIQSQCELSPQLFLDKSMTNDPINFDFYPQNDGKTQIFFTDKDGVKRASDIGQEPVLLYSNKDHPLHPFYFGGDLMTLCDPSKIN